MYAYMYSVSPKQSMPKLLLVLRFNTGSVLLLLSVFLSPVSASERREVLVEQLPNLLPEVPCLPSEALLCHTALAEQAAQCTHFTAAAALAERGAVLPAH